MKVTAPAVHVVPRDDLVGHDTDGDDCVCGPSAEPVVLKDGSMAWVVVHSALDGRT